MRSGIRSGIVLSIFVCSSVALILFFAFRNKATTTFGYSQVEFQTQKFHVFKIDVARDSIILAWKQEGKIIGNLKSFVQSRNNKLLMATNAGMFHPNRQPVGLYVEGGKEMVAIDTDVRAGNFYLKPNGVFAFFHGNPWIGTTDQYRKLKQFPELATQSGPMLVSDSLIHPAFNQGSGNVQIRSGVGLDGDGNLFFVISDSKISFYEIAEFFRTKLDCGNALYLDGTISSMYVSELKLYTHGDREFGPMIGVMKKKEF